MCGSTKEISYINSRPILFSKRDKLAKLLCVSAMDYATDGRFFNQDKLEDAVCIIRHALSLMKVATDRHNLMWALGDAARENAFNLNSKAFRDAVWTYGWWVIRYVPQHRYYGLFDGRRCLVSMKEFARLYASKALAERSLVRLIETKFHQPFSADLSDYELIQLADYTPEKTNVITCS